jgi:hypothetical protein
MNETGQLWFSVTTGKTTGNVSVDQYDCIQSAPRHLAWWIGRPMEKMVEELTRRGVLVNVEPL